MRKYRENGIRHTPEVTVDD